MSQPITRSISTSSQLDCSPQLQAVLGCLDIQLEEELTRYRRQRKRIKQTAFPSPSATQQAHKPSQVLMVTSEEGRLEPESADFPGDRYESGSQMTPAGWESVVMKPGTASLVPHSPDSSDALPDSPLSVPASSSAQTAPDRYLESSEALVKTIEERRAAIRAQRRSPLTSLFSPVGISSMLLLLLSSMTLGYVVLSPSGIATFQLNRFFRSGARVPQQNPASDPTPSAVVPPVGGTGQSPNLAAQEFVDLDLGTLSNISPTPTPISPPVATQANPPSPPAAPPASTPTGPSLDNLSEELLPESSLPPVQTAPAQTPKPPAGAPPQPKAAQPVIAADGLYYVVASYGDAASLENARAMVPDAYIREFQTGTKVQLGALDSPVAAQQLANELNAQGLTPQFDVPAAGE